MPIIIYLSIAIIIILLIYLIRNKKSDSILSILYLFLQWGFTIYEYFHINTDQFEYFTPDAIGVILLFVLSTIATTSYYYSLIYFRHKETPPKARSIYFVALFSLITSLACAYLSNHIAIMWIFAELTTLSSAILIYHNRTHKSLEATWKYLFISSVSIALIFIGILFLGIAAQEAKLDGLFFKTLLENANLLDEFWLKSSFLLVFTGFTVKAGLVPMYTAGIDAKDKAPTPASALFSSVIMNLGFLGIFRLFEIISNTSAYQWAITVLIISASLSIFVSAVYMIRVKNFKRMFAYSSIEHMGIMMLGMASGGIGYYGAVLHLILHSFAKSSLFYQTGTLIRVINSKFIKDGGEYFDKNTFGAIVLILSFFVVTAIPPSGLFVSEFLIFKSMFQAHYIWLLIIVVVLFSFIIWAMSENLFKLIFNKLPKTQTNNYEFEKISSIETIPQLALILAVVYLGFYPPEFLHKLMLQALINFK